MKQRSTRFSAKGIVVMATVIGLMVVMTTPARAEVVTLICQQDAGGGSFMIRVDYDRMIVDMPNSADLPHPVGTAFFSAAAQITESDVTWNVLVEDMNGYKFFGGLNRLTGQGQVHFPQKHGNGTLMGISMTGPCSRAEKKF